MTEVIGHRGYAARAPENTLASLRMALDAGADAVEWDVQVASCGTPVLFHDTTLERTSDGSGALRARSVEELRRLDAGTWFSDDFGGERIPTLGQALEAVREKGARAYCEIKEVDDLEDVDRVLEAVRGAGMLGSVVFISLDWRTLERVADAEPAAELGFVLDRTERASEALSRVLRRGRGFVDARAGLLLEEPSFARAVVEAGVDLGVWTVNDEATAERLADLGVTRFTTDEVGVLLAWRDGRAR